MRILTVAILLCGTALPAMAQDVSAVTQASQKFAAAMSGGDGTSAAGLFSDDAYLLPPGRRELTGKSEIQMFLNGMARGVQNLQYTSENIKPLGDAAAREVGSFSLKTKGRNGQNPQDVTGKYMLIWEKAGGDWKIAAEMWNRNASAQGGKGRGKGQGQRGGGQGASEQTGTE